MPRFVAIADTNFYRSSSDAQLNDLRQLERAADIAPLASYLASSELLSHVSDNASPSHRACRAAIKRMFLHCLAESTPNEQIPIVPDPHVLLADTLFPRRHAGNLGLAANFESIIARVASAQASDSLAHLEVPLAMVRAHRDQIETRFVESLIDIRRQCGLDPDRPSDFAVSERPSPAEFVRDYVRFIGAQGIVTNVARECRVMLDEGQLNAVATVLSLEIPTTLQVFVDVVERVLLAGANPSKQANSIWDMYFALLAADRLRFRRAQVILITDDAAILRVARVTNSDERVLSSDGYRALLLSCRG